MAISPQPATLDDFYRQVQRTAQLHTLGHARRWTAGVLKTLGLNLAGRTKRAVARALPAELAASLKGVFWLVHFRNRQLTGRQFLQQAARRSGHSDAEFARLPTLAVFAGLRTFLDSETQEDVARSLSPELRELWEGADPR
jgi:uncharacterized protein (DUF2267 family)